MFRTASLMIALALLSPSALAQTTTAFTYQGELKDNGQLANGSYDILLRVYTQPTGGSLVSNSCQNDVPVVNGRFTATADALGVLAPGSTYYVEVRARRHTTGVDCGTTTGFTTLTPRQLISAAPIANLARVAMQLSSPDGSLLNAVVVDNAGRVGIGTPTPTDNLHAFGQAAALRLQDDDNTSSFLVIEDTSAGQTRWNKYSGAGPALIDVSPIPDDGTSGANVRFFRETNTTGPKSVIFHAGNNSTATSAVIGVAGASSLFQLSGGNFGIGTPTPNTQLHVAAAGGPVVKIQDTGSDSTQAGFLAFHNSSDAQTGWMGFGFGTTNPNLGLYNRRPNGDIIMFPGDAGRVGIFTTAPIFTLDVNGTIRCTTLTQTSSAAFKNDIAPLAQGLNELLKLEPVSYVWNDQAPAEARGKHDLGFIAEDVANILPDAIGRDADGKPAGIDYSRITVLAVKAIKEQQAQHEADRALIRTLTERLEKLEAAARK